MFGNLLRECGVLNSLSETAQNVLANLITLLLGLTVAGQMTADKFVGRTLYSSWINKDTRVKRAKVKAAKADSVLKLLLFDEHH